MVFVVSILAAAMQIHRFTLSILGNKCDALNEVIAHLPIAGDIPGPKKSGVNFCQHQYWSALSIAIPLLHHPLVYVGFWTNPSKAANRAWEFANESAASAAFLESITFQAPDQVDKPHHLPGDSMDLL